METDMKRHMETETELDVGMGMETEIRMSMETNMERGMKIEMESKNDMERACEMQHTKRQFGKPTTHTRADSPTHPQGSPTHTRVLQHTLLAVRPYRFSYTTIKNPYSLRSLLGNKEVGCPFMAAVFVPIEKVVPTMFRQ